MTKTHYDFGLVGPNGQIGKALARALRKLGTVYELARGEEEHAALPTFAHVVNAAAFTKFNNEEAFYRYWDDNVIFALRIAELANEMGAHYHHLSSHGVAEFRSRPLDEWGMPEPTTRMKPYTMSKVIAEELIRTTSYSYTIYRCSDVIPSPADLEAEWRRNHWLSVLFAAGREAFPAENYPIWIADVNELAEGIASIISMGREARQHATHHLLGRIYYFDELRNYAAEIPMPHRMAELVEKVHKYVYIRPALAATVESNLTHRLLPRFSRYDGDYWREYAQISVRNRDYPVNQLL